MSKRYRKLGAMIALVLVVSLAMAGAVYAQGPQGLARGLGRGALEAVAGVLGMTADELSAQLWGGRALADLADRVGVDLQNLYATAQTARKESRLAVIDAAVEEGRISKEQAARMQEGIENGYGGGHLRIRLPAGRGGGEAERVAIAEALGLTVSELQANLWGGRTLADLADRTEIPIADVQAAAEAAREEAFRERIATAVTDGDITQDQADWMIEGLANGYLDQGGWAMGLERGGQTFGPRGIGPQEWEERRARVPVFFGPRGIGRHGGGRR